MSVLRRTLYALLVIALNPLSVLVATGALELTQHYGVYSNPLAKVLWYLCGYVMGTVEPVNRWSEGAPESSAAMRVLFRRDLWVRRRLLAYIPLALVTYGCYLTLIGDPLLRLGLARMLFTGSTWIHWGVVYAAFGVASRARADGPGVRGFVREALYGPTRWLLPAVLAALSLGVDPFRQTLLMMAVLLISCIMIAWQHEPMFVTRRGVIAWRIAHPKESFD